MTTVSAVIVNYNARAHLTECIRTLRADGHTEIVVADNASSDGSLEAVVAAGPEVTAFSTGSNLGFGTAANRGVARTSGEFVMILNPDTLVEPGTTKALVAALEHDEGLAAVGPRVDTPDGNLYPSARRFPRLGVAAGHAFLGLVRPSNRYSRRYRMLDWDHTEAGDVDWVSGTCLLVRRSAFEALGGFDERYFMYVEDVDLCWRLREAGWRVGYEPGGRVVHTIGASSELAPYRMILAHHRSLFRFAARSCLGARRATLPLIGLALAVRTVLAWAQRALRRRPHAAP